MISVEDHTSVAQSGSCSCTHYLRSCCTCTKEASPAATMLSSSSGVSESIGGAFGSPASTSPSASSSSWASGSPKPSNPTPLVALEASCKGIVTCCNHVV